MARITSFIVSVAMLLTLIGVNVRSAQSRNERAQSASQVEQRTSGSQVITDLGPSLVSVTGRQLILQKRNPNGTLAPAAPFIIKGVSYSPASRNTDGSVAGRRAEFGVWAATDIPLIKQMNVNTVYLFLDPTLDAAGTALLDQFYNNNIMVVMTVDEGTNNTARVQQAVNFYKNHPAILAWVLGSEVNINRYFTNPAISMNEVMSRSQQAAALIKTLDTNHPVSLSYGDIDINAPGLRLADTQNYIAACPNCDVWSLNIYRSNTFGTLFKQWQMITNKPMFIGEGGTDAFRSADQGHPPTGMVDESLQAQWLSSEWNDLFKNLSARHPGNVAIGGFAFEWQDEWWKVAPSGSQQVDGCDEQHGCASHPDHFANEEYWGVVDIDRQPRAAYAALTAAYSAGYQSTTARTFRALSRGSISTENPFQSGVARFYDNALRLWELTGGAGGGRGFDIVAINPQTSALLFPPQAFDTWASRDNGTAMNAMIAFLNSLPNGTLILISVCDEAGLNNFDACTSLPHPWTLALYQALESLGSQQIRSLCYRGSWAMVTVKGEGVARQEHLNNTGEANASVTLPSIPATISPRHKSFGFTAGSGTVNVSAPAGTNWTASTSDPFITITSGSSGSGNGLVTYSINQNGGGVRVGTIAIAGQTLVVGQAQVNRSSGITPFDFDSDAKTDLAVFRPSNGFWYILNSGNSSFNAIQLGTSSDRIAPGDYDGDGKTDVAVFRPGTGLWNIFRSTDNSFYTVQFGLAGDLPAQGDFDGDAKADIAVFRPSNGIWYVLRSSDNSFYATQFGSNGDVPVVGDYDNDGKSDIAVWRPSNGVWYLMRSASGFTGIQFGVNLDKSAPGDYDGDGKSDIAVFRQSTGVWYILRSSNESLMSFQFGISSDLPTAGDYDGDGKVDVAVYRPNSGFWYVLKTSDNGLMASQFGISEDKPIPSAFIP